MSLISVIIPTYNAEKTIEETIQSVLSQTFTDLELIVINDGSTDSTLEVINRLEDSRLKVFSYPNAGGNVSRNRGLAKASGEYISFIDADDLWTPDKLEKQLQALKENPQAGVAYSWTDRIDETGKFIGHGGSVSVTGDVLAELLIINFLSSGSNPLIRREAFLEVGNFDESLPGSQDRDMWLRLAARYHFVVVPLPQILYRVSPNSVSSNVFALEKGATTVINKAFAQAPDSLQYLKKYSLGNIYKYLIYKSFEGYPERKKALAASRFLLQTIRNDPSILKVRVIWKIMLNIILISTLPPSLSHQLRSKSKKLFDVTALFAHLEYNFAEIIKDKK
ncbi:MAG: glycosyltransferase [Oscillatoria sp. PMC 1068.18]|nr:glycosyltransferase [Oscillatoria sp. PMC 1068.18]